MRPTYKLALAATASALTFASPASAALTVFQTLTGTYGLSTDGGGSASSSSYGVSAFVPAGATVVAAYLYQSTYNFTAASLQPITLNGNAVTFGPIVTNGTACCNLSSARANVTALVAPTINSGAGGTYNFTIGEGNTGNTDGTALVVVYSLASLPTSTVAILDGFASVTGDTATINFATPLNPSAPGFQADVRLGIGFSTGGSQSSTVRVNGTLISSAAGGYDDGELANGGLITVGGNNDAFSPLLPTDAQEHERYNLAPYIANGSTSINFTTANASADDNIFLLAGIFSGTATVTTGVPEPATWAMMIMGFGLIGGAMRRRSTKVAFAA